MLARRQEKHTYALLHRIESLQAQKQPQVTKTTLEILHHFIACGHFNEGGIIHANTVVNILEKGN